MASDEEIQKELDAHIHRLELELSELKQRRNTLSPISRLPPEILCKIFLHNIAGTWDQSVRRLPLATPLSHVSHIWRRIAIGCPELWGILRVGVRTREEMLSVTAARAQQAPLTLNMRCFVRDGTPTVPSKAIISTLSRIVREGSARVSAFDLYAREDSLQPLLSGISAGFDNLTALKLDIVGMNDRYAPLTELLQCTFPRLRYLRVQRPQIPIGCSLLQSPHLTDVHIEKVMYTTTVISDLLELFKRSLGLRSLFCGIPFLPLKDPSVTGGSPIHAPKLELLRFNSTLDTAVRLLSSISIPSRARLEVYAEEPGESVEFMSLVGHAYGHVAPIALQLGGHCLEAWDISSLDAVTGQVDTSNTPWIHTRCRMTRMSIWDYSGWSFVNLRVLKVTFAAVGYNDSQAVFDAKQAVAAKLWTFLADSAIALETIRINNFDAHEAAVDTLMDCLRGAKRAQNTPMVPWPALHTLHSPLPLQSQQVQKYKRRREDASTPSLHQELEYALDLVDALKARQINGSGSSVRRLTLLQFSPAFAEPVEDDASLILRSGAATVKWQSFSRKT